MAANRIETFLQFLEKRKIIRMDSKQEFTRLKTDVLQKTKAYVSLLENMCYDDINSSAKRIELSGLHSAALTSYTTFGAFIYDNIAFEDGSNDFIPLQ